MGELIGIFIAEVEGGTPFAVDQVQAVAGRGLRGDRYFVAETSRKQRPPEEQVTLIALEAIQSANEHLGLAIAPEQFRRNLLTHNVDLNTLVGSTFRVGEVILRGLEPCDPCKRLERLTTPGMMRALLHHGGLRCEIVEGGTLHIGDAIITDALGA